MYAKRRNFCVLQEIGVEEQDDDVRAEVEIRPFRACAMHPAQEQFGHCGLGYGADTTFHGTYF